MAPHRSVIFGAPGLGKTSFACGVEYPSSTARPDVLVLDYESGTNEIDVMRAKGASSWKESLALLEEACRAKGDWRTIVIDTIDRIESQAAEALCIEGTDKKKNLRSLKEFGWNDGYYHLATRWREMLFLLESARANGRSVWLVAHIARAKVNDPTMGEFHEWQPAIHPFCWSATHQWADNVLFAQQESGLYEGRMQTTGLRLLRTVSGSGYQAKNRYNLPPVMPLSARAFEEERAKLSRTPDEVRASIRGLASGDFVKLAPPDSVLTDAGDDVRKLCAVERALQKKITETKGMAA